ncbi:MAG: DUF885 domain-containing protein [Acidobacteriaceae bacterium]|nr:DUF885 domain-containing protein [Acidobacteriaceae bacterium]
MTAQTSTANRPSVTDPTATAWDRLVDQFFDDLYFPFHPTEGTSAGFHRWDKQLEDYSRGGVEAEIKALRSMRPKVEAFDAKTLTPEQQADRLLVLNDIDGRLLSLEQIRDWQKDPDHYSSGVTNSVFGIMSRKFAAPEERLRSVIARERQMPKVFDDARHNLENPPKVFTEVALEQLPGIVSFFQHDVPDAFNAVKDPAVLSEFRSTNAAVIVALQNYEKWLRNELLPRSNGDFRIGAENYRKKLVYDEMVDTPLEDLLKVGYENLHQNQQRFKEVAAQIDPNKTPQQLLEELQKDYPPPDKLLQTVRDTLGDLRSFIVKKEIVDIPSPVSPIVEETPPFMRALSFASMDTPGPYEHIAKEAFFNVTLPPANLKPDQVAEFMAQFNYNTLVSVETHEAFPGHYVQFLWVQHAPSKVRKLLGSASNSEGWAHYCEQMMLDEGYGQDGTATAIKEDKKALKLRLGQIQDALLRNARFIAGIQMHTGNMSLEQAADFFVKEGYQSRTVGETEAKRGTSDPTYLVYTLGKLEILKLREDYKKKLGSKFNLKDFHDGFLKQGFPPVKIIRRAMLGDDSPVL